MGRKEALEKGKRLFVIASIVGICGFIMWVGIGNIMWTIVRFIYK